MNCKKQEKCSKLTLPTVQRPCQTVTMAIWRAFQRVLQRLEKKVTEENLGRRGGRAEGGREGGPCLCRAARLVRCDNPGCS